MKLKILVKIIEKIFGIANSGDAPRADMYLPERLLAMSLVFLAGGIACGVYAAIFFATWAIVCAPLGIILGIVALLCWKNQDSMTLFVAGKKVHIESMAVLSERLINHINDALQKLN